MHTYNEKAEPSRAPKAILFESLGLQPLAHPLIFFTTTSAKIYFFAPRAFAVFMLLRHCLSLFLNSQNKGLQTKPSISHFDLR